MQRKLYYVDDESDLLSAVQELLSSDELEVVIFNDPHVALKAILASPPDLLLLDFRMPSMTGDELACAIDSKIPKILLTGELDPHLRAKYIRVLTKPLKIDALQEIVYESIQKAG